VQGFLFSSFYFQPYMGCQGCALSACLDQCFLPGAFPGRLATAMLSLGKRVNRTRKKSLRTLFLCLHIPSFPHTSSLFNCQLSTCWCQVKERHSVRN
jgi:hypothetical protein